MSLRHWMMYRLWLCTFSSDLMAFSYYNILLLIGSERKSPMFSFLLANYPSCCPHSDFRQWTIECDHSKFLCHTTPHRWYNACWSIQLKCKVSEKLNQRGNGWCSSQGGALVLYPSITDTTGTIGHCKHHKCVDHSRYVWLVFLVDSIWIKTELVRDVSDRNTGKVVCNWHFGLCQHNDQFAKLPQQWRILLKLCRSVLETYNCMVHGLER